MKNDLLEKYYSVDKIYQNIMVEREMLREKIIEDFKKKGVKTLESPDIGRFTVAEKRIWKYTSAIEKKIETLKVAKAKEEQSGKAKAVISEYLVFKPTQND